MSGYRVIAVDDEVMALRSIATLLSGIPEIETVNVFTSPAEALGYVRNFGADIAFLDINMRFMDGLALAREIKKVSPDTYIIFQTGYSEYAVDAFRIHAAGYLLKPMTEDDVREAVSFISESAKPAQKTNKRICIQTFGHFEMYCDGVPVKFKRSKTKELLAYLVDCRGASVNSAELCAVLWEDENDGDSVKSSLRNLVADLVATLSAINASNIFIKKYNSFSVNPDAFDCDLYRFLSNDPAAINAYRGKYMFQYSWAEMSFSVLNEGKRKH